MNDTIRKFGYPDTLLGDYEHWVVLLRPNQVTAGSLVLACKEEATSMAEVSPEAFAELPRATTDLEQALRAAFDFERMNYLLLMMVDPHVHFHVLPRYSAPRVAAGVTFEDPDWPGPPDVRRTTPLSADQFAHLRELIQADWPARAAL